MDPDQARQNVRPDLDPNCFDTLIVFLTIFFFEKDDLKKSVDNIMHRKLYSIMQIANCKLSLRLIVGD